MIELDRRSVLAGASLVLPSSPDTPAGRFLDQLDLRMSDDGRTAELLARFRYIDPAGVIWEAPRGAVVDGASIPRPLWSIIGGPFEGRYRKASVIHDWYCDRRSRGWKETHRVFYDAMLTAEVGRRQAAIMYFGVRYGGPKWSEVVVRNMTLSQLGAVLDRNLSLDARYELSAGALTEAVISSPNFALNSDWTIDRGEDASAAAPLPTVPGITVDILDAPDGDIAVSVVRDTAFDEARMRWFEARPDTETLSAEDIERLADQASVDMTSLSPKPQP